MRSTHEILPGKEKRDDELLFFPQSLCHLRKMFLFFPFQKPSIHHTEQAQNEWLSVQKDANNPSSASNS